MIITIGSEYEVSFGAIVSPILVYGVKIWGTEYIENSKTIERVSIIIILDYLRLSNSVNDSVALRECVSGFPVFCEYDVIGVNFL